MTTAQSALPNFALPLSLDQQQELRVYTNAAIIRLRELSAFYGNIAEEEGRQGRDAVSQQIWGYGTAIENFIEALADARDDTIGSVRQPATNP